MGVNLITLCPTAHPTYTLGTYAIGIYGITPASVRIDLEYADEVRISLFFHQCGGFFFQPKQIKMFSFLSFFLKYFFLIQIQPFPAPVDRLSCSDVPPEEFNRRAGSRGDPVVCLEDGVTERVTSNETGAYVFSCYFCLGWDLKKNESFFSQRERKGFFCQLSKIYYSTGMLQMIVPLKEGCQKISFFGQALTKSVSFAVHCLNSDGDENTGNTDYYIVSPL